jgi:hypothetical protein
MKLIDNDEFYLLIDNTREKLKAAEKVVAIRGQGEGREILRERGCW